MKIPLSEGSPWSVDLPYTPAGIEDLKKLPSVLVPHTTYKIIREVTFANESVPHKITVVCNLERYDGKRWAWFAKEPFHNYVVTGWKGGIPQYKAIDFLEFTAPTYKDLYKTIKDKKLYKLQEELVLPPADFMNEQRISGIIDSWISDLKKTSERSA